jgi:GPH family glycoside/pentoside/hexuronide:cation symporter
MGSYILWVFTASYITVYATDCLQFSGTGWAYGALGLIILISRFFDGLSDIGMGIIIDRTKSKYGKARPWFGLSLIPLSIIFFFMFFLKGLFGDFCLGMDRYPVFPVYSCLLYDEQHQFQCHDADDLK